MKKGEINCVIVKDFSRFGRDYIELGDYLERIFPFLGVRFISINDHYDSLDYKGTTGGLDVVLKNIVYDYYSKDLSVKVKTAKRQKMKRGEYIGGHVPYGLMKDPDDYHKLIVDPEAGAVVREIFDAALSGMKVADIGRMLNEKGYETPGAYYVRKHPGTKKFKNTSSQACWNHNNLRKILMQEMYYGAVVGHKREGIGVGCKHTVAVPKEEQVIIEGKHPGIVTKEEFLEVQKIFRRQGKAKQISDKTYPLYRKVKCGTCGHAMTFHDYIVRGKHYSYFGCQHAKSQIGDEGCCRRYVTEESLKEVVWESVKALLSLTDVTLKKMEVKTVDAGRRNADMVKALADLQKKVEKGNTERFANVDRFMAGEMDKELYQKRRTELTDMVERLEEEIKVLEQRLKEAEVVRDDGTAKVLEQMKKYAGADGLDQKMVEALIEKVMVYDLEHVEIRWKFSDEILRFIME